MTELFFSLLKLLRENEVIQVFTVAGFTVGILCGYICAKLWGIIAKGKDMSDEIAYFAQQRWFSHREMNKLVSRVFAEHINTLVRRRKIDKHIARIMLIRIAKVYGNWDVVPVEPRQCTTPDPKEVKVMIRSRLVGLRNVKIVSFPDVKKVPARLDNVLQSL